MGHVRVALLGLMFGYRRMVDATSLRDLVVTSPAAYLRSGVSTILFGVLVRDWQRASPSVHQSEYGCDLLTRSRLQGVGIGSELVICHAR